MQFTTVVLSLASLGLNILSVQSAAVPAADVARRAEGSIDNVNHVYRPDTAEKRHTYALDEDEVAHEKRHTYALDEDEASHEKRHTYALDEDEAANEKRHTYALDEDEVAHVYRSAADN